MSRSRVGGGSAAGGSRSSAYSPKITFTLQDVRGVILHIPKTIRTPKVFEEHLRAYIKETIVAVLEEKWHTDFEIQDLVRQFRYYMLNLAFEKTKAPLIPWADPSRGVGVVEVQEAFLAAVEWHMAKAGEYDTSPPYLRLRNYFQQRGFESGILKFDVYKDVEPALDRWTRVRARVYAYSSELDRQEMEQLLQNVSSQRDIVPYFTLAFDASRWAKRNDPDGYRSMATVAKLESPRILFVTDSLTAARAAATAGMKTLILDRDGSKRETFYNKATGKAKKAASDESTNSFVQEVGSGRGSDPAPGLRGLAGGARRARSYLKPINPTFVVSLDDIRIVE